MKASLREFELIRTEFGVALTAGGIFFLVLGIALFFDSSFLALGNLLFLAGITLIIGYQKTFYFFTRKQKIRGSICFFIGLMLVFCKRTFFGALVEAFGIVNLFGDFFPVVTNFLRSLPVIGPVFRAPLISQILDKISGIRPSPV